MQDIATNTVGICFVEKEIEEREKNNKCNK